MGPGLRVAGHGVYAAVVTSPAGPPEHRPRGVRMRVLFALAAISLVGCGAEAIVDSRGSSGGGAEAT